mmetsp:Transcript_7018/g.10727  ORF Transcript_7018/g.10727 Transcript_7018/m.10727 type:complete len:212 (+) Transcript_7018:59-694(+)
MKSSNFALKSLNLFILIVFLSGGGVEAVSYNFTSSNVSLERFRNFTGAHYMDCGSAPLCGVVVLESGYGEGAYHHGDPCVHGLWPETGNYGSSECIAPSSSSADPSSTASCYDDLSFMSHEWEKHGRCAGVRDADDFFTQLCGLVSSPLSILKPLKQNNVQLQDMAQKLKSSGYPVYYVDMSSDSQIYLSACAGKDGQWVLADTSDFSSKC